MTQLESQLSDTQYSEAQQDDVATTTVKHDALPMWLAVGGELVGSFMVCFVIYAAYAFGTPLYGANLAFIAVVTAAAYALTIMAFSSFSRVQLNPAVTLASVLTSRTHVLDGVLYIIAQVLGAIGAAAVFRALLPVSKTLTRKLWLTYVVNGFDKGSVSYSSLNGAGATFNITIAIVVEVVAVLLIVAAAMNSTDAEGRPKDRHALAMGLAYGVGAAMAFPITGAALNPARSTGIALFAQHQGLGVEPLGQLWVFWIAPILAAAIVALVMVIREIAAGGSVANSSADTASDDTQIVEDGYEAVDLTPSGEHTDTEIQQQQPYAQADTDEGIKTN